MAFTLSGERGELRHGYRLAAELGPWDIGEGGVLIARITAIVNRFYLTRPGLVFAMPRAHGRSSTRPIADVTIAGDALTARIVQTRTTP
jgi:hypothetical protein